MVYLLPVWQTALHPPTHNLSAAFSAQLSIFPSLLKLPFMLGCFSDYFLLVTSHELCNSGRDSCNSCAAVLMGSGENSRSSTPMGPTFILESFLAWENGSLSWLFLKTQECATLLNHAHSSESSGVVIVATVLRCALKHSWINSLKMAKPI